MKIEHALKVWFCGESCILCSILMFELHISVVFFLVDSSTGKGNLYVVFLKHAYDTYIHTFIICNQKCVSLKITRHRNIRTGTKGSNKIMSL